MSGYTLDNLKITETFYGWYSKTNEMIDFLNSVIGDGVSGASLDANNHLIITLIDGTTLDAGYAVGPTGAYVSGAQVDGDGHLNITLNNGVGFDAGYVVGPTGSTGSTGSDGPTGSTGNTGPDGQGVPSGGFAGYALVKNSDESFDTEWADVSSTSRAHPGSIGGFEAGTGSLVFGKGLTQTGRELYPRWSTNYYMSQVHKGPGISMNSNAGLYTVAGYMEGFTSGYDDGLTSGIKILNFLENTIVFEGNKYTGVSCLGKTLDGPPGYYWNRMKYFPTVKLQPFYIPTYAYIDRYIIHVSDYESGVDNNQRRGTYGWFGVIKNNSFPAGTPASEKDDTFGFIDGSTCAYFFRPEGVSLNSDGFAVSVGNTSDFSVSSYTSCGWTGEHVLEVNPGRTGPISLLPSASQPDGFQQGFRLSPGWYYLVSEFIPTAWFSVGSALDTAGEWDIEQQGLSADNVILTHTDAASHYGDASLFGLNGFELAPFGEETGVGQSFTPSAYLSISSMKEGLHSFPTGLPPYLWYVHGLSGSNVGGRFVESGGNKYLGPHIGLHPIDATVEDEGGLSLRAQNAQQASAPRIALSIRSASTQLDGLRDVDLGTNPPSEANYCTYTWNGLSPWGGTAENCTDCLGGTAGGNAFDWHRLLFGAYVGTTADGISASELLTGAENIYWSSVNGPVTYKIQLTCESGDCPTFCAPPGIPITNENTSEPIPLCYANAVFLYNSPPNGVGQGDEWVAYGGSSGPISDPEGSLELLFDANGNAVLCDCDCFEGSGGSDLLDEAGYGCARSYGETVFRFTSMVEAAAGAPDSETYYGAYFPDGAHKGVTGFNCDSHYPGSVMNPYGLTTAGATANPDQGWIMMFDDSGNTYFFGFYNGETGAIGSSIVNGGVSGATTGCSDCFTEHQGQQGQTLDASCGDPPVGSVPPGTQNEPESGVGTGSVATISTFVNAQEDIHKEWFGNGVSGTEKNHLVKYTSYYGCTASTTYPEYQGP